jgi:hypothetical protein
VRLLDTALRRLRETSLLVARRAAELIAALL